VADINGISFIDTSTKGRLQIVGVEYDAREVGARV
jgi:hypothetical protein